MTTISKQFSPEDLRAVEAAVQRAEAATSGEVVTYIADSSDPYHLAAWKGAALGAVLAALAAAALFASLSLWDVWVEAWLAMPALLGGALGYLLGRGVIPIRRSLIDTEVVLERVERRANEVFLAQEVFRTRGRTGILLFVSLFERRVVVLADSGIREQVPPVEWEEVAADFAAAMRRGEAVRGLVAAIDACGAILARYRVDPAPEDRNELPDYPQVEGDR